MSFRIWCFCAAAVSLATAVLHVVGGGPEFHAPALESDLSEIWKAAFSVIWHQVTAFFALNGIFLIVAGFSKEREKLGLQLVFALNFAFAVLFAAYGLSRLGNLVELPQWVIALAIFLCVGSALRREGHGRVLHQGSAT